MNGDQVNTVLSAIPGFSAMLAVIVYFLVRRDKKLDELEKNDRKQDGDIILLQAMTREHERRIDKNSTRPPSFTNEAE